MKQYEKYKASGIEWLGDIPEHWESIYLKHIFSTIVGGVWGTDSTVDSNIYCIRVADFDYDRLSLSDKNLTLRNFSDSELNNRLLKKGDLVLEKSGGGEKTPVGRTVIFDLNIPAVCSNFTNRLEPKIGYESDYIKYLFAIMYAKKVTLSHVKQTTGIQNLSTESFFSEKIFVPSLAEQGVIARYLDYTVGRVDEVIGQKSELVERLQAKRKALINEVVTRGLNPDTPTRPSGIDWLGNIPEHWKISKIKYLAELKSGSNLVSEQIASEGEYPVYGGNGLRGYYQSYSDEGHFVLIGRQGALCGNINYAKGKFWATEHAVVCYPNNVFETVWFGELLRAMNLNQYSIASAQPGLAVERIKNLAIPYPSQAEQKEIVTFIEERTTNIDNLVGELQGQIERLRQYKTAIISEAITGKIDIRDWEQ